MAEVLVKAENQFNQKRKEQIRKILNDAGLNQTDLANLLGHRKGYMSELINGYRPFCKEDLVTINPLSSDAVPCAISLGAIRFTSW